MTPGEILLEDYMKPMGLTLQERARNAQLGRAAAPGE